MASTADSAKLPTPPLGLGDILDSDRLARSVGCMLGLAVGDALGTTNEFKPQGKFEPITDIVGGGPFNLKLGQWTDDTSMTLCLAASVLACKGFDAKDQMQRYLRWWREGYCSSTGTCFDIGGATSDALRKFETSGQIYFGSEDEARAGNGSLMRLAPIPIAWQWAPAEAIHWAGVGSRTTHGSRTCIDACRFYCALILGAIEGRSKRELLAPNSYPYSSVVEAEPLCAPIKAVVGGSYKIKSEREIGSNGWVVTTLEAALWCFANTKSYREGALKAANLGGDADTIAAIYGMLAGAFYRGRNGIPKSWAKAISASAVIVNQARHLYLGDFHETSAISKGF